MDTSKLLFSLIRSELMGNEIALEVKNCKFRIMSTTCTEI